MIQFGVLFATLIFIFIIDWCIRSGKVIKVVSSKDEFISAINFINEYFPMPSIMNNLDSYPTGRSFDYLVVYRSMSYIESVLDYKFKERVTNGEGYDCYNMDNYMIEVVILADKIKESLNDAEVKLLMEEFGFNWVRRKGFIKYE